MKTITRAEAIDALRAKLASLTDDEHCLCKVASDLHLYCGGFSQWKTHELRERYDWIVKKRPRITRKELEDLANRWQLARQFVHGTALACDTQVVDQQQCRGWDNFTDQDLATHYKNLLGDEVEIRAAAPTGESVTAP